MGKNVKISASRRTCIKLIVAAAGGTVTGIGGALAVGRMGRAPEGAWLVLTPEEAEVLGAVVEQIIPSDKDPGAREAGGVIFIDRQLDGPYERFVQDYREGLRCLELTSQAMAGNAFSKLLWPEQTRVLEAIEAGKVPPDIWERPKPNDFFQMIRSHTMQGFYGSPRHGGNRNYASYRMMGLEYPRISGRNRHPAKESL